MTNKGSVFILFLAGSLFLYAADGVSSAFPSSALIDETRINDPKIREISTALAHYITGAVYDNFSETEKAVPEYEKVLPLAPGRAVEVNLKLGADFLILEKPEKAAEALNKVLELDKKNIKARLFLSAVHTSKGEFRKAQALHEEALKYDPENFQVLTFLSDLFVIQREYNKAAKVYEKILQNNKDDAFLYFNLGVIYGKLNLLTEAEKNLERAIAIDSNYLEARIVLGFIYEIDSRYDDAVRQYNKVIGIDPELIEVHVRMGQLYERLRETDKALAQNEILMRIERCSPAAYLRNFGIYVSEKKYDEAEKVLKGALENNISNGVIYAGLGFLEGRKNNYEKAGEYYFTAIEKEPENVEYKISLAMIVEKEGKRLQAIKILEELVSGGNNTAEMLNYLGYMYAEEGINLEEAVRLLKEAVSMDPENGAYLDSLGWAYFKKEEFQKAAEELSEAVKYLPRDAVIREHLADVYFAEKKFEKAVKELKKVLELDPRNKAAAKKLRKIKEKKERKK